jgi:hypothetical protein
MGWRSTLEKIPGPEAHSPTTTEKRKDMLCIVLLCVITFCTWLPRIAGPIDLRWDAGVYYILGTSLAEGKGYRLLNEPGQIQAVQYPPLLPAIVAMHQKILHSYHRATVGIALRRTFVVLSLLYIICTFLLARLFLSRPWAFLLSLLCLLNYDMYFLSTLCFAELPFAFFSTLFAYLYYWKGEGSLSRQMAPAAVIACYLLRTAGMALLGAWIGDALLRKQFGRAAIRITVALMPVFFWQSYIHRVESGYTYQHPYYAYQRDPSMFYNVSYARNVMLKSPFEPDLGNATAGDMIRRVLNNAAEMPSSLGEAAYSRRDFWRGHLATANAKLKPYKLPMWPLDIFYNAMGLLVIGGIVWECWHRQWVLAGTLALTIAAVCTTPWPNQFVRYFAPSLPLLLLAVFQLLRNAPTLLQRIFPRVSRSALHLAIYALLSIFAMQSALDLVKGNKIYLNKAVYETAEGVKKSYRLLYYLAAYPATKQALNYLVARTDGRAILVASMPHWVYLETGLRTIMPPLTSNPAKAQQLLDSVPVKYVLIDQLLGKDNITHNFPPTVQSFPDKWKQIYSSKNGEIIVLERTEANKSSHAAF